VPGPILILTHRSPVRRKAITYKRVGNKGNGHRSIDGLKQSERQKLNDLYTLSPTCRNFFKILDDPPKIKKKCGGLAGAPETTRKIAAFS